MTDDEEGYPAGVMGIDSREMTEALMDEIARPIDWEESSARKTDEDANEFDRTWTNECIGNLLGLAGAVRSSTPPFARHTSYNTLVAMCLSQSSDLQ